MVGPLALSLSSVRAGKNGADSPRRHPSAGQYAKAAETCPKILGINAKLWEDWVFLFADKGEIKVRRHHHSRRLPTASAS